MAATKQIQTPTKEKRCVHKGAMQVARSTFQWCPNCGAGRLETKGADGNMRLRWHKPGDSLSAKSLNPKGAPTRRAKSAGDATGTIGDKQTRSRRPTKVETLTKPKRHRRTKAEMEAFRAEQAKATIAAAAPKRRRVRATQVNPEVAAEHHEAMQTEATSPTVN